MSAPEPAGSVTFTRRRLLAAAGAAAGTLALPGRVRGAVDASREVEASGHEVATFASEPSLKPPTLAVTTSVHPAPGYVFATTLNGPGQRGPMIVDDRGQVVWFQPVKTVAIDFRPQRYLGRPVLTWWEGTISSTGVGQGQGVIVDESYRTIARVDAGNGLHADVHELQLTPKGTALLTAYDQVDADLTAVGGPAAGHVLDSIVQEVDVRTGRVLFEWRSLDHVPLTDTYAPVLDPFDYFHVNSIDVDLDGNLIVSARNTSAVYKLDRSSGAVLWRLGGRSSDFQLDAPATFMYQHDARAHPDGTLTLFDDGPSPTTPQSRAIRLGLDVDGRKAVLLQQYRHPTPLAATAMGNAQVLGGGGVLVGWGTEPYVTEFGPTGDVRFDANFVGGAWNYRAYRSPWVGRPATRPAVHATRSGRTATVAVSWNGSTETARWRIEAGATKARLEPVATVPRDGFETVVHLPGAARFVAATALDGRGHALAASAAVPVRGA